MVIGSRGFGTRCIHAGEGPDPTTTPTVADGVVYYVGGQAVYAVDAATGSPLDGNDGKLFQTIGSSIGNRLPAVFDGLVFVCDDEESKLYAINSLSGQEQEEWNVSLDGGETDSSPVVVNGNVYVALTGGMVKVVDVQEKKVVASYDGGPSGQVLSSPVVIDGRVFVGGEGGLFVFERDAG